MWPFWLLLSFAVLATRTADSRTSGNDAKTTVDDHFSNNYSLEEKIKVLRDVLRSGGPSAAFELVRVSTLVSLLGQPSDLEM